MDAAGKEGEGEGKAQAVSGHETEERRETEVSEKIKLQHQPELWEPSQTLPCRLFSCDQSGKGSPPKKNPLEIQKERLLVKS